MAKIQDIPMDLKLNPLLEPIPDIPIIYDVYEMLIQEIDVLFSTDNTEVLCGGDNWANLKQYIFATSISESTLASTLRKLIYSECPSSEGISIAVDIRFFRGALNDIGVITVTITEDSTLITKKEYFIG